MHSQKGVLKELPALFFTHALKDSFPGDPTQQFLEQTEVPFPKAQRRDCAFCQARILQDHKLHQGMVTAAQVARNLNLSIYYLDQKVVNRLQESSGLSATCHATIPADIRVVEIPHQDRSPRAQHLLQLKQEGLVNRLPLIRWPLADPNH